MKADNALMGVVLSQDGDSSRDWITVQRSGNWFGERKWGFDRVRDEGRHLE